MKAQTRLSSLQIGIIGLTLITSVVHLYLGITYSDPKFLLNGIGYLVLLGAYLLPISFLQNLHGLIRWLYILFAAVTIVAYFYFNINTPTLTSPLGLLTKLDEVVLIVLLFLDGRK